MQATAVIHLEHDDEIEMRQVLLTAGHVCGACRE